MFRLTRLNLAYLTFFVLHCKTLCEVTKPFLFFFLREVGRSILMFPLLTPDSKIIASEAKW